MKKVMFMTNSLYGGGAEKILQTIINNLDYGKYDITLYSMHRERIDTKIYTKNFRYKVVFEDYIGDSIFLRGIFYFFKKVKGRLFNIIPSSLFYTLFFHEKYDVEIAFIEGESTKIISGSNNRNSKKYAWVHIDLEKNPWTAFLYHDKEDESKHYSAFDKIICVSNSVKVAFVHKFGIDDRRVLVKYNPIDRNEILKKAALHKAEKKNDKFRLISVGRLVEQKGYDRLLRIAYQLKQSNINFELMILGEGTERKNYERYIKEKELEQTVFLMGYQENPYVYMNSSDLFVCSSRSEGFSTVVTEAIILGLPVISTECAGIYELFGEEKCGIIVKNDENSLFNAIYDTLSHPYLLEVYRKASMKRGKEFSLENSIAKIEELLDV